MAPESRTFEKELLSIAGERSLREMVDIHSSGPENPNQIDEAIYQQQGKLLRDLILHL